MLTLFHDYTSAASAVAVARAGRLAEEGLDIAFEGFEAVGVDMAVPVTVDVLAEIDGVAPLASAEGVTLRRPAELPPTGRCHLVGLLAEQAGLGASWRAAAYAAFWRDAADIADLAVLAGLAAEMGLDTARVAEALAGRTGLAAVRRRTARLRGEGVGGVPTILAQRTLVPGLLPEADVRVLAAL